MRYRVRYLTEYLPSGDGLSGNFAGQPETGLPLTLCAMSVLSVRDVRLTPKMAADRLDARTGAWQRWTIRIRTAI